MENLYNISPIDKNQLKNMKNLIDQLAEQHEQIFFQKRPCALVAIQRMFSLVGKEIYIKTKMRSVFPIKLSTEKVIITGKETVKWVFYTLLLEV